MSHPHSQVVVAGGGMAPAPMIEQGQGMLVEPHYVGSSNTLLSTLLIIIGVVAVIAMIIWLLVQFNRSLMRSTYSRW